MSMDVAPAWGYSFVFREFLPVNFVLTDMNMRSKVSRSQLSGCRMPVNLRMSRDVANAFLLLIEMSDVPSCADRAMPEAQPYVLQAFHFWDIDLVLGSIALISRHRTAANN
jgi:hypothetical protein